MAAVIATCPVDCWLSDEDLPLTPRLAQFPMSAAAASVSPSGNALDVPAFAVPPITSAMRMRITLAATESATIAAANGVDPGVMTVEVVPPLIALVKVARVVPTDRKR